MAFNTLLVFILDFDLLCSSRLTYCEVRPVVPGCAGCAMAHPDFGRSVNPISTRGADYAHHNIACPPGFENVTASLPESVQVKE